MGNENHQNDRERHEAIKKKLKVIGIVLLVLGVVLTAIGFISLFSVINGGGGMPKYFWCAFIGLPMIGIGIGLLSFAYKQEISRYVKNESVPVINETGKEISPAVRDIASAVKEGLSDNSENSVRCSCGEFNEKGSKFCKKCGKNLLAVCPFCGKEITPDSAFCNQCGNKIR